MFFNDFVKHNKIDSLWLKCSNVRISADDFRKDITNIKEDPDKWFETFVQHHADIAMFNDQANSFESVNSSLNAFWIPGGPHFLWSFEP
jgi:hypothetical protein